MTEMHPTQERYIWLDICKGISIVLVIMGHISSNTSFFKWIYSFHMPLFFFLAGITFNAEKSAYSFLEQKTARLVFPYLIGDMFVYSLYLIYLLLKSLVDLEAVKSCLVIAQSALIAGNWNDLTQFNGVLWFLPAMFSCEVTFFFICKIIKNKWQILAVCFYIFCLSIYGFLPWIGAWTFTESMRWMFWLCLGYAFEAQIKQMKNLSLPKLAVISGILICVSICSSQLFETIDKSKSPIAPLGIFGAITASMVLAKCEPEKRMNKIYIYI